MKADYYINPPSVHRADRLGEKMGQISDQWTDFAVLVEGLWRVVDSWFVNYLPRQARRFIREIAVFCGLREGRDSFRI